MSFVALTISPKAYPVEPHKLLEIFNRNYISKIRVNYILFPELDLKGRLHFHGIIERSKDNIKDYLWSIKFLERWTFICVKEIKNMAKWLQYCKKDWKITKKLIQTKEPLKSGTVVSGITLLDYPDFIVENC